MDASIHICKATAADAGIISRIVERSIRVGCALDHRNHPQTVATWTHNKTIEHIQPWLSDPRLYLNIALLQDKPVGVAMASISGRIAFCYVQPEWFRRGAGQALVQDLEGWLANQGCARRDSTAPAPAKRFTVVWVTRPCAQSVPGRGPASDSHAQRLVAPSRKADQRV